MGLDRDPWRWVVWRLNGIGMAVFAIVSLLLIENQGLWEPTMLTGRQPRADVDDLLARGGACRSES